MLWDPSSESWIELGINGQPAGLLPTPIGEVVASWRGGIPEDDMLEAAAIVWIASSGLTAQTAV